MDKIGGGYSISSLFVMDYYISLLFNIYIYILLLTFSGIAKFRAPEDCVTIRAMPAPQHTTHNTQHTKMS